MGWTRWGLAIVVLVMASGCGARSQYRVLPRNVRESVHRDYPDCRGRDVRGVDLGGGRYQVVACGIDAVYACETGRRSRSRGCQMEGAGVVAVSGSQPSAVLVVTTGAEAPPPVYVTTPAQGAASQGAPVEVQPASASREQVEGAIRGWLDSRRTTILGCTQTQAALVEVSWDAAGVPSVALGGEMHGSPGEACVVQQLAGVQLQNVGEAGALRHVIQ